NAVTRPISGYVVKGFGHKKLSRVALPLQAAMLMAVPFFDHLLPLLLLFIGVGFLRAVVLVANTIGLVEDLDETRVSRGVASGVFHAAGDIGVVLGPSTGGLIASYTGIARLFFVGPLLIVALFSVTIWACKFLGTTPKKISDVR
ncbi:MAG TPA: MFS transporter, partial [Candidatus Binatia bacterium]